MRYRYLISKRENDKITTGKGRKEAGEKAYIAYRLPIVTIRRRKA